MVAEVDVNQDTGAVIVRRLVIANDSGPISNPDGLRNQLEGGAIQGISRALLEEVTWDESRVTSVDWRTTGRSISATRCRRLKRSSSTARTCRRPGQAKRP